MSPLLEDFDLFTDKKKKHFGLKNLLDTESYNEKESCRFNLKWMNNAASMNKLTIVGDSRNQQISQFATLQRKVLRLRTSQLNMSIE